MAMLPITQTFSFLQQLRKTGMIAIPFFADEETETQVKSSMFSLAKVS